MYVMEKQCEKELIQQQTCCSRIKQFFTVDVQKTSEKRAGQLGRTFL
jgi:hypothetical protein